MTISDQLRETLERAYETANGNGWREAFEAVGFPQGRRVPDAASLSPEQRGLAEWIVENTPADFVVRGGAMPNHTDAVARWLGMTEAGPLERPTEDGRPLYQRLEGQDVAAEVADLGLSTDERLELARAVALFDYPDVQMPRDPWWWGSPDDLDGSHGEWARKMLDIALDRRRGFDHAFLPVALLAAARSRGGLESRHVPLLTRLFAGPPELLVECAGGFPDAEREPLLTELIRQERWARSAVLAGLQLLEACPTRGLADAILSRVDEARSQRPSLKAEEVEGAFAALGAKHPAIEEAYAAYRSAKKPVRKLMWRERRRPKTFEELDATDAKQLAAAGRGHDGRRLSAKTRLKGDPDDDERSFVGMLDTRMVVDDAGEHVYDLWLIGPDSGVFFVARGTEVVAQVVQGSLECDDPSLAEALRAVLAQKGDAPAAPDS